MNNPRFKISFNVSDWPLAAKLTAAVLILLIPATIIINAILLNVLQQSITTQIGTNLHTLADSTAANIAQEMENTVDDLDALTRNRILLDDIQAANATYPDSANAVQQRLQQLESQWAAAQPGDPMILALQNVNSGRDLRTFINAKVEFADLLITDKYGGLVALTNTPENYSQAAEPWWQAAYNNGAGAVYIGPAVFDPSVNLFRVEIALPVIQPNATEVIGVIHANYRLRNLVDQLAEIKVGNTGRALLVTHAGNRLDTTAGASIMIPEDEWNRVLNNTSLPYYLGSFQGRQSLVTIAPVETETGQTSLEALGWFVVLTQDIDEGLADQRSIATTGALIVALGLVFVSFFAVSAARSLVRPIAQLTETARQAQAGNLEVTAPIVTRDEVGSLSEAFNSMIGEIRTFTGSLEQKVAERTAQLAAINEITSVIASSLDINEVMSKTVNLIRDRLGYYHVSIFLLDEKAENAVVRESTGEIGRLLKERPHTLAVGSQSIIGFVTANRQPRVALDTRADAGHFKNPLLPNTRSEMALPLIVGETLFGALDVQSTVPDAFSEEDVAVLQNMTNQVAFAINNARLFQQVQERLNEVSMLNRQYLGQAWDSFAQSHPESVNLQLEGGLVNPAPELESQGSAIGITAPTISGDGRTIAIPITLRDENIGEFALSHPEGTTRWSEDDLTLVDAIITQVALAVENARLLEETQSALSEAQRLARRERVLSEITTKITYGADVKRILQIAADELRRATGSSRATVRLTPQPLIAEEAVTP